MQIDEVELLLVIVQSAYHRKAITYLSIVKNKLQVYDAESASVDVYGPDAARIAENWIDRVGVDSGHNRRALLGDVAALAAAASGAPVPQAMLPDQVRALKTPVFQGQSTFPSRLQWVSSDCMASNEWRQLFRDVVTVRIVALLH